MRSVPSIQISFFFFFPSLWFNIILKDERNILLHLEPLGMEIGGGEQLLAG